VNSYQEMSNFIRENKVHTNDNRWKFSSRMEFTFFDSYAKAPFVAKQSLKKYYNVLNS
jgi:hypothetical protein